MLQTVKRVPFHRLKRCQTALKTAKMVPFSLFSVPSDTVSDSDRLAHLLVEVPRSVYAAIPGRNKFRPSQETPIDNLVLAGDWTSQDIPRYGRRIGLESVPSAVEQAKVAAATICGNDKEVAALPWFWSDQYDLKLQIAELKR